MRLKNKAEYCGRLGVMTDKAASDLEALLGKWFAKHFITGLKLPLLKSMNGTESFAAFEAILSETTEANLIATVRKLDPHQIEILHQPKPELLEHLRRLASGETAPAPKPRPPKAKSPGTGRKSAQKGGVLSRSRQ